MLKSVRAKSAFSAHHRNFDSEGRKKSVSFSDPLEEVFYIDPFRSGRTKSVKLFPIYQVSDIQTHKKYNILM